MKIVPEKQPLMMEAVMLLWCTVLILGSIDITTRWIGVGLLWNLLLATVPLFWSAAFQNAIDGKRPIFASVCFGLWLLFLPNAPYILTDLIHLQTCPSVPLWYVLAVLLSCAGTGTLLGYHSLLNVQNAIETTMGKTTGWVVAAGSLLLCGFGIYLGRFLRWNSWDALTKPLELAKTVAGQFADPGPHPHPLGVTLVFGVGLLIGYLALRSLAVSSQKV
ncbi:DUF1361 domain-containing protein [bacterium]|nr:MAG: DUF1361 domain-containing protein [bacterium]